LKPFFSFSYNLFEQKNRLSCVKKKLFSLKNKIKISNFHWIMWFFWSVSHLRYFYCMLFSIWNYFYFLSANSWNHVVMFVGLCNFRYFRKNTFRIFESIFLEAPNGTRMMRASESRIHFFRTEPNFSEPNFFLNRTKKFGLGKFASVQK
jgi:hypothetical protein